MTFGEYVRELRIRRKLTLRAFCRKLKIDPGNWSKIERGLLVPPKSRVVLAEIAKVLNLKEDSEEWYTLFDLAAISHIPREIVEKDDILDKLPVFFRTLRGEKPTEEELKTLIKLLKEG